MDDIHITLHYWPEDSDEDGEFEELRVNGEVAISGRPLGAAEVLKELEGRKGIFEECVISFEAEPHYPGWRESDG